MSGIANRRVTPHWSTAILGISAMAMIVVSTLVDDALSSPKWWLALAVVSLSWWYVRRRTQAIAETSAKHLDERELATRNVAAWWGQTAMLVLGAATVLMLTIASRLDHVSAELALEKSGGIVLSLVILGASVPTLVVASLLSASDELDAREFDPDEFDPDELDPDELIAPDNTHRLNSERPGELA